MAVAADKGEGDLDSVVDGPLDLQEIFPQPLLIYRRGLPNGTDVLGSLLIAIRGSL